MQDGFLHKNSSHTAADGSHERAASLTDRDHEWAWHAVSSNRGHEATYTELNSISLRQFLSSGLAVSQLGKH